MRAAIVGLFALLATSASAAQPLPSGIDGVWDAGRQSQITIAPCDAGHCGYLTKIVVPPDVYAAKKDEINRIGVANFRDYKNQDPNLRGRPMLGLQILTLDTPLAGGGFEGEIYNPEDGKTYYGKLEIVDVDHIRLTGCALFNVICQAQDWVRTTPPAPDAVPPPGTAVLTTLPGALEPTPEAPDGGGATDRVTPAR